MSVEDPKTYYISRGFTIIPLRPLEKTPKVEGWTTKSAAELLTEFAEGDNIGVRLERPFFVVDVDDARLVPLIEEDFPHTLATKTARGYHFWFRAVGRYPKTIKKTSLIQLLAEGCQVVAPPSKVNGHEYRFVDAQAGIAALDDKAVEKLERIITALGEHEQVVKGFAEVWDEGHRHNLSLWLMGALRKSGVSKFEAAVIIKSICLLAGDTEIRDRLEALKTSYAKPSSEVAGWSRLMDELENMVGVEKARALLEHLPNTSTEGREKDFPKPKTRYVVIGEVVDGKLVDVVSGPRLLIYEPESGEFKIVDEFIDGGGYVVKPPPHIEAIMKLTDPPSDVGPDPTLWVDIRAFITDYFDHLDERVYDVMVSAVLWSYFYRDIQASTPYLLFLGPWRSGKTRALEVLEALCYRGVRVVDPSEASIFRTLELYKPTLIIDEHQIADDNVRAIMASGYRWGAKVMRVDPEADGFDGIKFYNTFAFMIYASREEPKNDILSRSLVIRCEKNTRPTAKKINEARARELRKRLLRQKIFHHGKVNVTFEEFQSDDGRLQEIVSPLIVMARVFGGAAAAKNVEDYGREMEAEISALESTGPEAQVLNAVAAIISDRHPFTDEHPTIAVSEITRQLNDDSKDGSWKPEAVGRILSRLGFRREKLTKGVRAYSFDLNLLGRYCKRYGISDGRWQISLVDNCHNRHPA